MADILAHYTPFAIIAAGSILRGQGGPTSDIDLYVLHHAPFRQRLPRRYHGVPFEIFVNPPQQVRRYFEDGQPPRADHRAHLDDGGCRARPRPDRADAAGGGRMAGKAAAPMPTPGPRRFAIADELDNARDIVAQDSACAALILHSAVSHLVEYAFLAHNQHLPRQNAMLAAHDLLDSEAATTARTF